MAWLNVVSLSQRRRIRKPPTVTSKAGKDSRPMDFGAQPGPNVEISRKDTCDQADSRDLL